MPPTMMQLSPPLKRFGNRQITSSSETNFRSRDLSRNKSCSLGIKYCSRKCEERDPVNCGGESFEKFLVTDIFPKEFFFDSQIWIVYYEDLFNDYRSGRDCNQKTRLLTGRRTTMDIFRMISPSQRSLHGSNGCKNNMQWRGRLHLRLVLFLVWQDWLRVLSKVSVRAKYSFRC